MIQIITRRFANRRGTKKIKRKFYENFTKITGVDYKSKKKIRRRNSRETALSTLMKMHAPFTFALEIYSPPLPGIKGGATIW